MAGPTASVLFAGTENDAQELVYRARAACGDNAGTNEEFWLEGRPFLSAMGTEYPERLPELVESGLPRLLEWMPEQAVTFAALCNGAEDHRLLARLCLALCEETGGVVDFGGSLPFGPVLGRSARSDAIRVANPKGLDGVLFATTYETVTGPLGTTHYGDASLLRAWLEHPDFRMIK